MMMVLLFAAGAVIVGGSILAVLVIGALGHRGPTDDNDEEWHGRELRERQSGRK